MTGGPLRLWIMLFLAVALITASCGGGAGPSSRTVTFADSGKTMEIGVGDTLLVKLGSSPGTGFDWSLSSPPTSTLELAERTVTPSGTLLGGPATVTYRFRAAAAGEATLSLGYARSWESVPPARTFELKVRVRQ